MLSLVSAKHYDHHEVWWWQPHATRMLPSGRTWVSCERKDRLNLAKYREIMCSELAEGLLRISTKSQSRKRTDSSNKASVLK